MHLENWNGFDYARASGIWKFRVSGGPADWRMFQHHAAQRSLTIVPPVCKPSITLLRVQRESLCREEGVAVESGTGRGGDSFLDKHHIYSAVDTAASAASQHGHLVQRCYKHEHQCLRVGWAPGVRHATLFHGHPSTHKCSVHPPSRTLIPNSMFPTSPALGTFYCSRLTFGLVFLRLSSPFHQLSIHSIMKLLLF